MASKVANISDLLHCVASSCLSQRLPGGTRAALDDLSDLDYFSDAPEREAAATAADEQENENEHDTEGSLRIWEEEKEIAGLEKVKEMEILMGEVFETVSAVKRAYSSLQQAHSPWDPDKMRAADAAVVAELRKLGRLRDRFRRGGGRSAAVRPAASLGEAVAPYEAALNDLKRELKSKEAEVESLRDKLRSSDLLGVSGRKGRSHSSKRVRCVTAGVGGVQGSPTPELFELCMEQVKSASKSFTSHLLALMRAARWDISSAIQSILTNSTSSRAASSYAQLNESSSNSNPIQNIVVPQHAKYALESYINRRLFHGFEHESFYLDGSLASLLDPAAFRRGCFTQFRDMRSMDPAELLGLLPTCQFGRFAAKKFLSVVHSKMEESLFGHTEQRLHVVGGAHPRTGFYAEFLRVAKAVWMLHLLAFALDPSPVHFEVAKGAEFQAEYMESVVRFAAGRVPNRSVVAFHVAPGFKLGNGSVIRARVYVVPRVQTEPSPNIRPDKI